MRGPLIGVLLMLPIFLFCQKNIPSKFIHIAYFNQKIGLTDLKLGYQYRSVNLEYSQFRTLIESPKYSLNWEINPQLGFVSVKDERHLRSSKYGIEGTILFGLSLEANIAPNFWRIYIGGAIGPQFVSQTPNRQKSGFIFSDNLFFGNMLNLFNHTFDFRVGFRHQSNAGLGKPNGGINSLFIKGGFLFNN